MNKLIKQAFTLIELLVVIAIIGILSGLIVVSMGGMTDKATIAKAQVFSNSLRNSLMLNILLEWKFDQVNIPGANQTLDSWGTNIGTLSGATGVQNLPQLQTSGCVLGNCLSFDGTDDCVYAGGGSVTMDLTHGYAAEGWAKYESLVGDRGLLRRYSTDNGAWFILAYRNSGSAANYIQSVVGYTNISNATQYVTISTTLQENKWYHLVLSVEANGVSKFYINGVALAPVSPISFLRLGGNTATNTAEFQVGGPYWFLDGLADNIRVYSAPILTSQIRENYFVGLNGLLASGGINEREYSERINMIAQR